MSSASSEVRASRTLFLLEGLRKRFDFAGLMLITMDSKNAHRRMFRRKRWSVHLKRLCAG